MDATKRFIMLILSAVFRLNDVPIPYPYDLKLSITEGMTNTEFCDWVHMKTILVLKITPHLFVKRLPTKDFIEKSADYIVRFPNDVLKETVCNEVVSDLNRSLWKNSAVILGGFFSPDFVKSDLPYKLPSNRTGNVTSFEFCSSLKKNIKMAASDIVARRGLNETYAEEKILNYSEKIRLVLDDACDEIITDLNRSKNMKTWKDLDDLIAIFNWPRNIWYGAALISDYRKEWEDSDTQKRPPFVKNWWHDD